MVPCEVLSECMTYMHIRDVKHACLAGNMFHIASKSVEVKKIIRTAKIQNIGSYKFDFDYSEFKLCKDKYVNSILENKPILKSQLESDLNFVFNMGKRDYHGERDFILVSDFDILINIGKSQIKVLNRESLDAFLEYCSSIYERALDSNSIKTSINIHLLLERVMSFLHSYMVMMYREAVSDLINCVKKLD